MSAEGFLSLIQLSESGQVFRFLEKISTAILPSRVVTSHGLKPQDS